MRIGAFAMALRLHEWGKLPTQWHHRCPCCRAAVLENTPHLLLDPDSIAYIVLTYAS